LQQAQLGVFAEGYTQWASMGGCRMKRNHSKVWRQQNGCGSGQRLPKSDLETWSLSQLACWSAVWIWVNLLTCSQSMQIVSTSGQPMVLQLHLLSTWVKRQEVLVAASRQYCEKNRCQNTKD